MRFVCLVSVLGSLSLAACGGDDGGSSKTPDAPPSATDVGFNKPTKSLKANMDNTELGAADLSCLNTPTTDAATTVAVTLNTKMVDFQTGAAANPADHPSVTAFKLNDSANPFDTKTPGADASVSIAIPVGVKRFGFKMTSDASLNTLLLNQIVEPGVAVQTVPAKIQSVSKTTANLLPGLVGITRTPGSGVVAGALRDCAGHEISNFVATVSSTKDTTTILTGADTYYFSTSAGVPVRHPQAESSSADGLFVVIQLPTAAQSYVQVWGYLTDADLAADHLTLISQLSAPLIADTVVTGSFEPVRSGT